MSESVKDALRELRDVRDRLEGEYNDDMENNELADALGADTNTARSYAADTAHRLIDILTDAVDAWQRERDAHAVPRTQGPVERALREEWAKEGHGKLGESSAVISSWAADLFFDDAVTEHNGSTASFTGDLIGSLLDELGEPQLRADYNDRLAANYFALRSRICATLGMEPIPSNDEIISALRSRLLPEGCSWPTYEGGTRVEFKDVVERLGGRNPEMVGRVAFSAGVWSLLNEMGETISQGDDTMHPARHQEPDSIELIRVDATCDPECYCHDHGMGEPRDEGDWRYYVRCMALDLVRRTQALAGDAE
jgi:hypothetical protein